VQGKFEGKLNEPMRDLVNTVMNLRVPQKKKGHCLTSYTNVTSE